MDILGIGNALVDIFAYVEDDFPSSVGFHKSTVSHVKHERLAGILPRLPDPTAMAGGGASNVVKLAALLGLQTAFVGCIGDDEYGAIISRELLEAGAEPILASSRKPTGIYCTLMGYDERRTAIVSPGASRELRAADIPEGSVERARLLFLELFLLSNQATFTAALDRAKTAGISVAIDLSNPTFVGDNRQEVLEVIERFSPIVFGTEEETSALTGMFPIEGASCLAPRCSMYVLKRGKLGVTVYGTSGAVHVAAPPIEALETTGAGDAFAAGFLSAVLRGIPLKNAAVFGTDLARESLDLPGTRLDRSGIELIRKEFETLSAG